MQQCWNIFSQIPSKIKKFITLSIRLVVLLCLSLYLFGIMNRMFLVINTMSAILECWCLVEWWFAWLYWTQKTSGQTPPWDLARLKQLLEAWAEGWEGFLVSSDLLAMINQSHSNKAIFAALILSVESLMQGILFNSQVTSLLMQISWLTY